MTSPRPIAAGTTLGGFRLIRPVGRGGWGEVWCAEGAEGLRAAVKVLRPPQGREEEAQARFDREASLLARLSHPHLVGFLSSSSEGGLPYLALEWVDGCDLQTVVRRDGPLPLEDVLRLVREAADVLAYLHGEGVLHRDLKPSNFARTGEGALRLLDLGLATDPAAEQRLTGTGDFVGTPGLAAPEVGNAEAVGPWTDAYGLGMVLYWALTGRLPYEGRGEATILRRQARDSVVSPRLVRPEVPAPLADLVCRLLAPNAADRPQDLHDVEAALDDLPTPHGATFARPAPDSFSPENADSAVPVEDPLPARAFPRTPQAIGSYNIRRRLGVGGMGEVFLGEDASLKRRVAIKLLPTWLSGDPEILARFRREAEALAALRHPGILGIYTSGMHEDRPYLVTEYVKGLSLDRLVADRGACPPRQAARHIAQAARAVGFAHRKGILHRDLKPANVMVREGEGEGSDLQVIVMDFGLAGKVEGPGTVTQTGKLLGTPAYMAPEQALADPKRVGVHTDIYGLGATLYALLCGHAPYQGSSAVEVLHKVVHAPLPSPSRYGVNLHRDLVTITEKCLEKDPSRRYASADDLAEDLERFLRGERIRARPVGTFVRWLHRARRSVSARAVGAGVLLSAAVFFLYGPVWRPVAEKIGLLPGTGRLSLTCNAGGVALEFRLLASDVDDPVRMSLTPPLHAVPLRAGTWRITAEKENWLPAERTVEIRAGEGLSVHLTLHEMLLWSYPTKGIIESSTAVADLDGDGYLEVAATSQDGFLHVMEGASGRRRWTFDTGSPLRSAPAVADLDGDGAPEILACNQDRLCVVRSNGELLWSQPVLGSNLTRPAVADFDSDGVLDCIVTESAGAIRALSGCDGAQIWSVRTIGAIVSCPALAFLDPDDVPDVLVVSQEATLHALSGKTGDPVWPGFALPPGTAHVGSPALGEFDGDGIPDIVVGCNDGNVRAISGCAGKLLWSYDTGDEIMSTAEIVDLDGDGTDDVVIGCHDGFIYALDPPARESTATRKAGAPEDDVRLRWKFPTNFEVWSHISSADIDGTGSPTVIAGSDDGYVYALRGRDGSPRWRFRTGGQVICAAEIADLDDDGFPEAVLSSKDGQVYAVRTGPGRCLWSVRTESPVKEPPVVIPPSDGDAGCVVIATQAGKMCDLAPQDGGLRWIHALGARSAFDSILITSENDEGRRIVASSYEGWVSAISSEKGQEIWRISVGGAVECLVSFPRDSEASPAKAVAITTDGHAQVVDLQEARILAGYSTRGGSTPCRVLPGEGSGCGPTLVLGSLDRDVRALDAENGQEMWRFPTSTRVGAMCAIDVDGDDRLDVVAGCADGEIHALSGRTGGRLWSSNAEGVVAVLAGHEDDSQVGSLVLVGTQEGRILALSARTGETTWTFVAGGGVGSLCGRTHSTSNDEILVGTLNGLVYALSPGEGRVLWRHRLRDGAFVASLGMDLTGDGVPAVVVGSEDFQVTCLAGGVRKPLGILRSFARWHQIENR